MLICMTCHASFNLLHRKSKLTGYDNQVHGPLGKLPAWLETPATLGAGSLLLSALKIALDNFLLAPPENLG